MGRHHKMWDKLSIVFYCCLVLVAPSWAGNILEIQSKTSSETDAGMNGGITLEICNGELVCCNTGKLDSARDDFNKGMYDVFAGSEIGECGGLDLGQGDLVMVVTHNGLDAWLGEWIRIIEEGGVYRLCPLGEWLDNFETKTIKCT